MVLRLRGGAVDEYGDPQGGWAASELPAAWVAPVSSEDTTGRGRDGVVVDARLYGPYGLDINEADRIEVDGQVYRIVGVPQRYRHPLTGWEAGVTVDLVRAAG